MKMETFGKTTRKELRQRIIEAIYDEEKEVIDFSHEWMAMKAFEGGKFTVHMMKREINLFKLRAELEEYGISSALVTEAWFKRHVLKDKDLTDPELRSYLPIGAGGAKSAGLTRFSKAVHLSNLIQTEMSCRKSAKGKERIITEAVAGSIPIDAAATSLRRIGESEIPSNLLDFRKLVQSRGKRKEIAEG